MKVVVYLLACGLAALGLLFVVAAGQGNAFPRIAIGVICLAASAALVALVRLRPLQQTHVHQTTLTLSGDVSLEELTCKQCGGSLSERSVALKAGAVFVTCEFCGAQYQLEEAPKW